MKKRIEAAILAAVVSIQFAPLLARASEKCEVTIRYTLEPTKPLPAGLKSVAILDSAADVTGGEDEKLAQRWTTIAADMIEQKLAEAASSGGPQLTVAKRLETRARLRQAARDFDHPRKGEPRGNPRHREPRHVR